MEFNFDVFLTLPSFYTLTSRWEIMGTFRISNCKGNSQIPNSNIPTLQLMWHFVIPATLCNHPPKKLHQVTMPIDHSVCVTYCLSLPHCSPFYFHALLLPSYSISILFHTISNTFCISYSPLISLPWSTVGCYALCSLCSPPSLGESSEFSLWIPLASIWASCLIMRLPLQ